MSKKLTVLLSGLILLLSGCFTKKTDSNIADISLDQKFYRFDQDLFAVPHDSVWDYVPALEKKYGNFFEAYNNLVIKIGGTQQFDYDEKLVYFLTDPYIENAQKEVQKVFPDLPFQLELSDAFKRISYYFQDKKMPEIYTHISGFNQSVVVDSGYLSISLDKYLGADSKFYSMLRLPNFLRANMTPQKITSDAVFAYLTSEFFQIKDNPVLLDEMIYYGKIHYFIDAVLPEMADSLKWGFPNEKLKWLDKNERKLWLYLVENKLLFSSDVTVVRRYIDDGPFTATFSKQSPARVGQWLGYQIVKSYAKQHPGISPAEILKITDSQKILNQSKYKP